MTSYIDEENEKALGYIHNDTQKALDIFNKLFQIQPDNIKIINGKASALMKLRRFDEAAEYFEKSLYIEENVSSLINLGIINKNKGQYEDALYYFDKAIELKPELANIITGFKKDIFDKYTIDELNPELVNFSDDANNLILQGLKCEKTGNYWNAVEYYEKAIDKDSSSEHAVNALINKINIHIYDDFLYEDRTSSNIYQDSFKLKAERVLLIEKRPKKASLIVDKLLDKNPEDVSILNYKGGLEFCFENYYDSIKYFDKCIDLNSKYYYAIFNKGLVLRRLKRYEEALACFNKVSEKVECYSIIKSLQSCIRENLMLHT